jgi:hypothetical protein
LRRRQALIWGAVYVLWVAALMSGTISVTDAAYKTWELRLRQIWRMASAAVQQQAPDTFPLYVAALILLTFAVPLSVWAAARARDDLAVEPDASPSRASSTRLWRTEPALRVAGIPGYVWTALVAMVALAALLVMTPAVRSLTFSHSGGLVEIPNGFRSGAHGWHISRAESVSHDVLRSGRSGWLTHHQGGYPAESAPVGVTWITVAIAKLSLGKFPIAYAHTIVAIGVFLLPAVVLVWIARRDGWPPPVGAVAAILHFVIPGAEGSGGYRTIVSAGRVEDAAAAACVVLFIPLLDAAVTSPSRRRAIAASLCAAAAVMMTPSAALLIIAVAAATGARYWRRTSEILGVAALLSSVAWVPLLESSVLYQSAAQGYESAGAYAFELLAGVTPPVFLLALVGAAVRVDGIGRLPILTLTAIAITLSAARSAGLVIPYLEVPRLMAFERLLVLYLAAIGSHAALRITAHAFGVSARTADAAHLACAVVLALAFAGPWPTLPQDEKGLFAPTMSARIETADLAGALHAGVRRAPSATAVLIVGRNSEAPVLWAPVVQDGLFFYNDPVWHWRKSASPALDAAWDPRAGTAASRLLSAEALASRGIGVVIGERELWRKAVVSPPTLQRVYAGTYFDAFTVLNPSRVVDWSGTVASISIADDEVTARGIVTGTEVQVRRNWHPRWRALVNGRPAPVRETHDGFMRVGVEPGVLDLQLRYTSPLYVVALVATAAGAFMATAWLGRRRLASG